MTDNSLFDPGTGGDTYRSKDRSGVKTEIVGIDLGIGTGTESLMSGSMPVNDNSGSLTVDNAGTFAVQIPANSTVNQAQIAGTATDTNSGVKSAGTQRVVLATDQPQLTNALKVDGSAVTQPVSGTVTATGPLTDTQLRATPVPVSGTVTASGPVTDTQLRASAVPMSLATLPALTTGAAVIGALTANQSVNNAQVSGTAVSVNAGTTDAGTQRVILASNQNVVPVSDNAGSLTVDAPVGTPVFVTITPSATGGWSKVKYAAQTTTVQTPKGTAGTFGGYYIYNPNASVAYLQVFDVATATTVTLGTTAPDMIFAIPAAAAANLEISNGVNMALGIKLACTTTAGGSTAPTTGLDITTWFK